MPDTTSSPESTVGSPVAARKPAGSAAVAPPFGDAAEAGTEEKATAAEAETQEKAKPAQPGRPPLPDPDSMTRLHETLPASATQRAIDPAQSGPRPTPGTLPSEPTQATDPGAAKPGTPGID